MGKVFIDKNIVTINFTFNRKMVGYNFFRIYQLSTVTLNELAIKLEEAYFNFKFQQGSHWTPNYSKSSLEYIGYTLFELLYNI